MWTGRLCRANTHAVAATAGGEAASRTSCGETPTPAGNNQPNNAATCTGCPAAGMAIGSAPSASTSAQDAAGVPSVSSSPKWTAE
jgi:hypothetical protein